MKKWFFVWIPAILLTLPVSVSGENPTPAPAEVSAPAEAPSQVERGFEAVPLEQRGEFDFSVWAQLPICRDGRIMPLDAFARTHVRLICGRENPRIEFADGKKRKFQASEILFSWLVEPEKWGTVSFIPLEDVTVRELMELPLFDESGFRQTHISPVQFSEIFNSVKFNEKLGLRLQALEEAEHQLAQMREKGIASGKDFERETRRLRENRELREKLEVLENRYVSWLRLTSNPLRNLVPEGETVLRDSAHLPYMGQTVSLSYLEQNLIFMFCGSYEPRLSLRGADLSKISSEELKEIQEVLKIPSQPERRFTPSELYVSFQKNPKLWLRVPFLYLESGEIRKVLGLSTAPEGEMPYLYVSPMELVSATQARSAEIEKALAGLSPELQREMNRLDMSLQLYLYWLNGQFLENVPLGQRFYSDYESLQNCWHGRRHASMGPAQPLDVQLLTIVLQRSPRLYQKMALSWRPVSPNADLGTALNSGSVSEAQWNYLLSCMEADSPELAFFKALRNVSQAFRNLDSSLKYQQKREGTESDTLAKMDRLALVSRELGELSRACAGVLKPLDEYCASVRAQMPKAPSSQDQEWYSWLAVSRVALRNFADCAAALQYALFDEDLGIHVLPAVEGVPLNRDRTERVQIFSQMFELHCQPWVSLNALRFGDLEDGFASSWPESSKKEMETLRQTFAGMAAAWKTNRPQEFRAESVRFAEQLRQTAAVLDEARSNVLPKEQLDTDALAQTHYPKDGSLMKLETRYLRFRPFVWAWILPFAGMLILSASAGFEILARKAQKREEAASESESVKCESESFKCESESVKRESESVKRESESARKVFERFAGIAFWIGLFFLFCGVLASTFGLALRSWIMNRAPVTNMFETIVFVAWSAGIFGMVLTFRVQFYRIISLGWRAVKFTGSAEGEAGSVPFRSVFWGLRILLALCLFFLLGFYGLGSGSGYTAVRLTPALAIGASWPSLSAWVEWFSGILMLSAFLWWAPLFLLAPIAGAILYRTQNSWTEEEQKRLSRQKFQRPFFAGTTALVVFLISYISISFPDIFKPDLRNLAPILRDNYWLAVHVITIVASYGAGMLAWGLANGSLFCILFGRYRTVDGKRCPPEICSTLSELLYRCMQAAVLLLVVGTILGGLWADVSWGKFWSWDRKEVWALISLFVYLLILHGRYVRLLGEFTLAIGAVLGAFAIVMAWYGVNFVMGSALHGYGSGSGSLIYGGLVMGLNFLLILTAVCRYALEQKKLNDSETENSNRRK